MRERERERQLKREAGRKMLAYLVQTGEVGGRVDKLSHLQITLLLKSRGYDWWYPPGEWIRLEE